MGSQKKIIITGGHHNSALVVAEALRSKGYEVVWLGHKFSMVGDRHPSAEYQEVTRAGFTFVALQAGKSHQWRRLVNLWRFPWGFIQAFYFLAKHRPHLILSFGGYLAVPVVIVGWLLQVPSITHEQTVTYGLANRLIAFFAQKVMISWPQSVSHFPAKKVVLTGLPLRNELFKAKREKPSPKPTIYITGGKQGAQIINQAVKQALPDLLMEYNVIHQCGWLDWPYFKRLRKRGYQVRPYFYRQEIGQVLARADLVVSRAGAHTVYELAALGKPALLIPIPWSHADEQARNAQLLAKIGLAKVLPQNEISRANFTNKIKAMMANLPDYQKAAPRAQKLITTRAVPKIMAEVQQVLE